MLPAVQHDSLISIFFRFLRFGLNAWGGPVAQIAMIRRELVERERWIDSAKFNRVLGVYQALPGPEAHELCVYFGYVRRGRIGGLLAGLGFMLPGFVLILALAWLYVHHGIDSAIVGGVFYGCAPAVAALVVRAVRSIGAGALVKPAHWIIAIVAAAVWVSAVHNPTTTTRSDGNTTPTLSEVGVSGLRAGLLTFGGAYTAVPFLQHDAVEHGEWLTNDEFVDGIAIAGSLPAPLIIFSTFDGYVAGGFLAALVMTFVVFLPAFAFTLIGFRYLERAVNISRLHALLEAITAAVVGLIAVTALTLIHTSVDDFTTGAIFVGALVALQLWKSRASVPLIMLLAGAIGFVATRVL
jgi:chromate transporter